MTLPAFLLAASGIAALLALVLSFVSDGRVAHRLAVASLWLALASVPSSIAWDIAFPPTPADASAKATPLAAALAHVTSYAVVVMPFAGIAMIAMRRATIASSKRDKRA